MNVNILISIFLNLPDGKNNTEISVVDGKNVSTIHVFIDTNITNIDPTKYTNVVKVTSNGYKNSSEVIRLDNETVTEAATFDIPELIAINDTNISEEVSLNILPAVASDRKNISKDNSSEVTKYDNEDSTEATTFDIPEVIAFTVSNISNEVTLNTPAEIASDEKNISKVNTQVNNVSNAIAFDEEKVTSLSDQLYDNVVAGKYDDALSMSIGLDDRAAVTRAVTNLIDTNPNNTMDYAYRLWTTGGKDIVTESFPPEFKAILKGDPVTIVSKDFGSALTLAEVFLDQKKPVLDLREVNKVKASWQMIPIWENGNSPVLYFKIKNVFTNFYLYIDWLDLGDGLRGTWAYNDAYTEEHLWVLKPVAKNTFKIINRKYPVSLSFNNYYAGGTREGWVWASDEVVCKNGDSACPWSYEWFILPSL